MDLEQICSKLSPEEAAFVKSLAEKANGGGGAPEEMAKRLNDERKEHAEVVKKLGGQLEETSKRLEETSKKLGALEEKDTAREYEEKAKGIGVVPGVSHAEVAKLLRGAFAVSKEQGETLEKSFKASAEALKKSGMFGERGSSRDNGTGTAAAELQAAADALQKDGVTKAKAYTEAMKRNPELVKRMREERA